MIDRDGRVLGDSELDGEALAKVENHANRPEVRQAIERGAGKAVRYSATAHTNYMYVARQSDPGIVRLAMPLTQVDQLAGEMRSSLLCASLVAVAFTILLSYLVALKISGPMSAAISNLIDNAINYSRPGGEISISGQMKNDGHFVLDIADAGYGIPLEDLPGIFERFYRVDKAGSRDSGGTGLGLAIAKHAVESQGGRITVESRPGEGSTFTIYLAAGLQRKKTWYGRHVPRLEYEP